MIKFDKHPSNPIFGSKELGTCFDVYITKENGVYRMDFSWRAKKSLAVTFSKDGIHWEAPQITLEPDETTGWEDRLNRNCVLKIGNKYKMWYTGQARGYSYIGYAESYDGINFKRAGKREPVMVPEAPWEKDSVMNPCVIYENGIYKMWYAAGETYEPNVLCYAESNDGISWEKSRINPIFVCNEDKEYEQNRVGGCQVVKTPDMGYLMMYIGYKDIDTACICAAKSPNGKTMWERSPINPFVVPDKGMWDEDSCYKPSFLWEDELKEWRVWYNGRKETDEFIGMATCKERNLFKGEQ